MKVELLKSPSSGYSLYINDYRIAGAKPWGGGQIVASWNVTPKTIMTAMGVKEAQ